MEQDLDPKVEKELKQAALLIAQAQSVVAFTGAGISVESGRCQSLQSPHLCMLFALTLIFNL
jgi:hypothetical protein